MIEVSIVVPCFQAARFLRPALESVVAQTFGAWELCAVDDGSSDGTAAILLEYERRLPGRFQLLRHPAGANRGVSASRNLALRQARGRYIAFLDADDCWRPDKLAGQVPVLANDPGIALVYGRAQCIDETGAPLNEARPGCRFSGVCGGGPAGVRIGAAAERFLRGEVSLVCSSAMARRGDLLALGGQAESLRGFEDALTWVGLGRRGDFFCLPEVVMDYRMHAQSYSCAVEPDVELEEKLKFYCEVTRRFGDINGIIEHRLELLIPEFAQLRSRSSRWRWSRILRAGLFLARHYRASRRHLPGLVGRGLRAARGSERGGSIGAGP